MASTFISPSLRQNLFGSKEIYLSVLEAVRSEALRRFKELIESLLEIEVEELPPYVFLDGVHFKVMVPSGRAFYDKRGRYRVEKKERSGVILCALRVFADDRKKVLGWSSADGDKTTNHLERCFREFERISHKVEIFQSLEGLMISFGVTSIKINAKSEGEV